MSQYREEEHSYWEMDGRQPASGATTARQVTAGNWPEDGPNGMENEKEKKTKKIRELGKMTDNETDVRVTR